MLTVHTCSDDHRRTLNTLYVARCRHNIDNVCIESMSVNIKKNHLTSASTNIRDLERKVQQLKKDDADKLKAEYVSH